MPSSCANLTDPNSMWDFCPSFAPSILFTILFVATTIAHIAQAAQYKKGYCWVIIMSGIWQIVCYIFRDLSIKNPDSFADYAAWFILILMAPLWTNAFVYMVVARAVYNFKRSQSIWHVKAWNLSYIFITLDIIVFVVQAYGAGIASGNDISDSTVLLGLHVYMGGVGLQQCLIIIFGMLAARVLLTARRETTGTDRQRMEALLYTVLAVLGLISLRIIFRLIEYSKGLNSTIPSHEAYQYCLDSLPMLVALCTFNIVHPGRLMPGKESEMPSLKQRRQAKKAGQRIIDGGSQSPEDVAHLQMTTKTSTPAHENV